MNVHAPIKLGDRQEQFCLLIVEGKSATAAYREAYNANQASAEASSSRLLSNVRVKARIDQIRADNAAAQRITVPFLTGLLLKAYHLGIETKQSSAASQAVANIAKLHGLMVDRQQVDLFVRKPSASPDSPDDMSEAAWLGEFAQEPLTIDASPEPQVLNESPVEKTR